MADSARGRSSSGSSNAGSRPGQLDGVAADARARRSCLRARSALPEISCPDLLQPAHGGSDPRLVRLVRRTQKLATLPDRRRFLDLRYSCPDVFPSRTTRSIRSVYAFHSGESALGFITDLGYATKMVVERLARSAHARDRNQPRRKLLQADPHRPWPVKQRIQSRHGHLVEHRRRRP